LRVVSGVYSGHLTDILDYNFSQNEKSYHTKSYSFTPRSLSEFVTTLTELNAIAPAANIGLSNPNAAKGIPILL